MNNISIQTSLGIYLSKSSFLSFLLAALFCISEISVQAQCGIDLSGQSNILCDEFLDIQPNYTNQADCDDDDDNSSCTLVYSWSGPNNFTSDQENITVSEPGVYTVSVTDCSCCVSAAALSVEVSHSIDPTHTGSLCNGLVKLFANSVDAVSYTWTGPNGFVSTDENPYVSEAGTYILTAEDVNGCTRTDFVIVEECYDLNVSSFLEIGQNDTVNLNEEIQFKIQITNEGLANSGNFTVVSQLPENMAFVGTSDNGTHSNGLVSWNLSDLASGENIKLLLIVEAQTLGDGTYTIWSEIVEDDGLDFDSTPNNNLGENTGLNDEDDNDFESVFIEKGVNVLTSIYLQGASINGTTETNGTFVMRDDLRQGALLPYSEPYTMLNGFEHVGDGGGETLSANVYDKGGQTAFVDWLIIDLRDTLQPSQVISTRAAMLQRDGKIVDVDGESPVAFPSVEKGYYHVSIRHRNHLGVMTAEPVYLELDTTNTTMIDFTNPDTPTYGEHARVNMEGRMAMWAGDINADGGIVFQGNANENNQAFFDILTANENTDTDIGFIYKNYGQTDTNLDCNAIFQGSGNDLNIYFFNILNHPANIENLPNFEIVEQLPD